MLKMEEKDSKYENSNKITKQIGDGKITNIDDKNTFINTDVQKDIHNDGQEGSNSVIKETNITYTNDKGTGQVVRNYTGSANAELETDNNTYTGVNPTSTQGLNDVEEGESSDSGLEE